MGLSPLTPESVARDCACYLIKPGACGDCPLLGGARLEGSPLGFVAGYEGGLELERRGDVLYVTTAKGGHADGDRLKKQKPLRSTRKLVAADSAPKPLSAAAVRTGASDIRGG